MASTCSRCGPKRAAQAAGSRALLPSRINSTSRSTTSRSGASRWAGPTLRLGAVAGRCRRVAADYPREDRNKKILELLTFRLPVKAGSHLVQVYFASKTTAFVEDLFDPSLRREPYRDGSGNPKISSVTITGPQPATATIGDTASRRRILTCSPRVRASVASARQADDEASACARKIISTLARRAYRRPVTEEDLQAPLTAYRDWRGERRIRGGHRDGASQHPR